MKKKIIYIGVPLLVIGVALVVYYFYTSTPKYSLYKIKAAYDNHDITSFEKYVDIKSVSGSLIDKLMEQTEQEQNSDGSKDNGLGQGLLRLIKPQMEEVFRSQIVTYVETGSVKEHKEKIGIERFVNKKDSTATLKGIGKTVIDGKVCTVTLEIDHPRFDTLLTIDLRMRDKGGYWQLIDLSDMITYTSTLETLEKDRIKRINEQVLAEFNNAFKVEDVKLTTKSYRQYYMERYIQDLEVVFQYLGTKPIESVNVLYYITTPSGRMVEVGVIDQGPLGPENKIIRHFNYPASYSKRIVDDNLKVTIEMAEIKYSDGTELKWATLWE